MTTFSPCGNNYLAGRVAPAIFVPASVHRDQLLRSIDIWALARLCVEHMQPSKTDYLEHIGAADRNQPS
jgi:hypothetical protein